MALKKFQLYSSLWQSCDELCGGMDTSQYKDYVRLVFSDANLSPGNRRCCMIQLRREWGRFSNFSFRTPQRRISAYPARPSG